MPVLINNYIALGFDIKICINYVYFNSKNQTW